MLSLSYTILLVGKILGQGGGLESCPLFEHLLDRLVIEVGAEQQSSSAVFGDTLPTSVRLATLGQLENLGALADVDVLHGSQSVDFVAGGDRHKAADASYILLFLNLFGKYCATLYPW